MQNCNSIQIVPTGTIVSIIPVGEERVYERFGSNTWDAAGVPDQVPRMNVGIWDGDPLKAPSWVKTTGNLRGWNHTGKLYVSPTNFLVMGNPAAGANQNLSAIGNISRQFGTGPLEVISDTVDIIAGGTTLIRPPVGEEWIITDIGAELWVGAPPAAVPEVMVDLTDGVSFARMLRSTDARGWYNAIALYLTHDVYLRVTNANGGAANTVCWSGTRLQTYASNQPNVMSAVATVLANGTLDAQPTNVDEEWLITGFGSSTWIGVAPAGLPDMSVNLVNATPLTSLIARNVDFAHQLSPPDLAISRANFLRFTETSVAGCDLGFSAIRTSLLG
jgi:type IV secretory pathway TrbD component